MKGLGFFDKIIFVVNSLMAFLLLLSYLLPYIPPKTFPLLSVLSLGVPFLIIINAIFLVFWLIRLKKQLLLSLFVLGIGWSYVNSFYRFASSTQTDTADSFSIMSFNVREFNVFKWLPNTEVKREIADLVVSHHPDIICLQEASRGDQFILQGYNQFNATYVRDVKGGLSIYTKYEIINSGSLEFPDTYNNAIFADIVRQNDTIRVYNVHLQSSKINTNVEALKNETSENLLNRLSSTFKTQQDQVELIKAHQKQSSYKTIITGDLNNTSYSYIYNELRGTFYDSFEEAGHGFGKTFNFKFFPLRIDFILLDNQAFRVINHETLDIELSDHFPILSTVQLH